MNYLKENVEASIRNNDSKLLGFPYRMVDALRGFGLKIWKAGSNFLDIITPKCAEDFAPPGPPFLPFSGIGEQTARMILQRAAIHSLRPFIEAIVYPPSLTSSSPKEPVN